MKSSSFRYAYLALVNRFKYKKLAQIEAFEVYTDNDGRNKHTGKPSLMSFLSCSFIYFSFRQTLRLHSEHEIESLKKRNFGTLKFAQFLKFHMFCSPFVFALNKLKAPKCLTLDNQKDSNFENYETFCPDNVRLQRYRSFPDTSRNRRNIDRAQKSAKNPYHPSLPYLPKTANRPTLQACPHHCHSALYSAPNQGLKSRPIMYITRERIYTLAR